MSASGVGYFIKNYASFDYEQDWKIWFDFKNVNLSGVNNKIAIGSIYSGIINMTPPVPTPGIMFSQNDYLAVPSNRKGGVSLYPTSGIWSEDFSLVFLNKKETIGKTIIFNCLTTGYLNNNQVYQGYRVGYTDTNKPFFEYYDQDGLKSFVGDFNLPTSHSLNFIKSSNSLSIGYYDILKQQNNTQSFNINASYLMEPTGGQYNLGYNLNGLNIGGFSSDYQSDSGVVGIDEFLYFKRALYDHDIKMINSGFVADYNAPVTGSGILYSTGITGYSTGLVPIFTGITGYGITGTGITINDFGVSYTGYLTGALYGNISGSGVIPLTGIVQTVDYFLGNGSVIINSGFIRSFYNSGVAFLYQTDAKDIIEYIVETGALDSININQYGKYDWVNNNIRIFEANPAAISVNGQIQLSGRLINTGTLYNPQWYISGDFYNSGYALESLSGYNINDTLFTFGVPTSIKFNNDNFSYTGGLPYIQSGVISNNSIALFNGIKLNPSQYQISGSNLIISQPLYEGITGKLTILDISGNFAYNSGIFNLAISKYNRYYSLLFVNGLLLNRGIDYLPISRYSLLNNSGIFTQSVSPNIYNDLLSSDLFWKNP